MNEVKSFRNSVQHWFLVEAKFERWRIMLSSELGLPQPSLRAAHGNIVSFLANNFVSGAISLKIIFEVWFLR